MADSNTTTKRCPQCRRALSRDRFARCESRHDGLNGYCKDCMKARRELTKERDALRQQQWHRENKERVSHKRKLYCEQNKERIATLNKAYRDSHQDQLREYFKTYHRTNRAKKCAVSKAHYLANKPLHLAKAKKRRENNKAQVAAYFRRYDQERPETHRTAKRNYKARKKRAQGSFSPVQWLAKCSYWGWTCYLCHAPLTPSTVHAEHRIPLSRGGTNWIANIAPSCVPCNLSKNNKTEAEYREYSIRSF